MCWFWQTLICFVFIQNWWTQTFLSSPSRRNAPPGLCTASSSCGKCGNRLSDTPSSLSDSSCASQTQTCLSGGNVGLTTGIYLLELLSTELAGQIIISFVILNFHLCLPRGTIIKTKWLSQGLLPHSCTSTRWHYLLLLLHLSQDCQMLK